MNRTASSAVWRHRAIAVAALLLVLALGWLIFRPRPLVVDVATAGRGPMSVTVDQEGEVRVHDRYVINAPVSGRMVRIDLDDGDTVRPGQTVAEIEPVPLDPRTREEALARVAAAEALVREALQNVRHGRAELGQAKSEEARMERLAREAFVADEMVEKARTARVTAAAAVSAAEARATAARSELSAARATLLAIPGSDGRAPRHIALKSPVGGHVLRVLEKSERTVAAGTPLVMIGDPTRFEIVADVLSSDAVKIRPGASARLEEWGGDAPLAAKVRTVEPYAFTKVSALGIEEQRVNVVMDPVDPLGRLGDGYRVLARIVVWAGTDVLKVPSSAVFRDGDGWAVFTIVDGIARLRRVAIGHRNGRDAEVTDGLAPGTVVVRYPTNDLADGVRVRARGTDAPRSR
ncbi:MAG: HlyD family efflux transporter periplasmic adaptor subunit [Betaproteobacteria bacterium]|nr:HlyD family efflux transporter periplasmic adaptor subunit [Betaproteobacteria bacterium]